MLVAVLAAASAVGVVGAALRGTGADTAATGAAGAALTLTGGGIQRARRHRGHHRVSSANPPAMSLATDAQLQPAVAAAMSRPPAPADLAPAGSSPAAIATWAPPSPESIDLTIAESRDRPASTVPTLFLVPSAQAPDPMVDTVPHPVVKLFPLAALEPDLAAGSIDDRVYAAFDAERRHFDAAALAGGRHASHRPTDAAAPRSTSYRSKHSA